MDPIDGNDDTNLDDLGGGGGGPDDNPIVDDPQGGGPDDTQGGAGGGASDPPPTRAQRREDFNRNLELQRQLRDSQATSEALRDTISQLNKTLQQTSRPAAGDPRKEAFDNFLRASKNLKDNDPESVREWMQAQEAFFKAGMGSDLAKQLREEILDEVRSQMPPQRSPVVQRVFNDFDWLNDPENGEAYEAMVAAQVRVVARRHNIPINPNGQLRCTPTVLYRVMREAAMSVARANNLAVPGGSRSTDGRQRFANPGGRGGAGGSSPGGNDGLSSEQREEILKVTAAIPGNMYRDPKTRQLKSPEERIRLWQATRGKEEARRTG